MKITEDILIRFLKCETTQDEEVAILDWLDADPENIKTLNSIDFQFNAAILHSETKAEPAKKKSFLHRLIAYSAAAVIAAVIAVGNGMYQVKKTRSEMESLMTSISVPAGQRICMTLQDGSRVWLNAGSTMEYPNIFREDCRTVKLSGEAFFDVTTDKERPFLIETFACNVEVLGTKFNIEANAVDSEFSTALLEGSVRLTENSTGSPMILKPGEKAELIQGRLRRSRITNPDEYLWTDGIISLQCDSFSELLKRLEKAYDVRFVVKLPNDPVVHCKGKIRVSDGIEHAMEILRMGTDFEYEINHSSNEIYIH
ncbi:MAG: FecR family protein [Bacteroidales bacterium]|nr:FecR family protein [Bacteroidales bacterium]MBQ3612994.1 FecR family protein [Bacteroidales bacterium]